MRGGRILWGQIAVVFAIVLVMVWAATQWTAFRLRFQLQLGNPWFELAGWPVYYPPAFFWWWYFYDAYAPPIFVEGAYIADSWTNVQVGGGKQTQTDLPGTFSFEVHLEPVSLDA